jgi:UDP-glucose 4-epimerase
MNILITGGGAGYIGCHTAVVLCQLGHDVVLLDNLSNSSERVLDKLFQITGKQLPLIRSDARNAALAT